METKIIKPQSVARADFIKALMGIINSSELPPYVLAPILKDAYNDVSILINKQLQDDMVAYQRQIDQFKNINQE